VSEIRNVAIIGEKGIGKTTLANALLGWDIFPQSYENECFPTEKNDSKMMTDSIQLTDTPGYCLLWDTVPEETVKAVREADTIIAVLGEELDDVEDAPEDALTDPEWESCGVDKAQTLQKLLEEAKTRDILFVIAYDTEYWEEWEIPLEKALHRARKAYSAMTDRGEEGFFCVDPMKALIGEIEADDEATKQAGIVQLREALVG